MSLGNISVFGEEAVENTQSGLQIHVDDVFCSGFWLWKTHILH